MEGKRRVTISKNGVTQSSAIIDSSQIRPSSRAPKRSQEGLANFGHFRGADSPEWQNNCPILNDSKKSAENDTGRNERVTENAQANNKIKTGADMFSFADDLSRRLKDIDLVADVMAKKVQTMKKEMDSKKEMDALNDDFNGPNRIRIISQAKREMRKNKRILLENRELRHALAEHQTVLEMVMNKFRRISAHAANLERVQSKNESKNGMNELKKENQKLAERVGEMLSLMSCAISHDNRDSRNWLTLNTKIRQLQDENVGLRELLHLSKRNGSIKMSFEAEESQNSRTSSEESVSHNLSSSEEVTVLTNASSDEENLANQEAAVLDLLSDINDNPDFDPPLVTEDVESESDIETASLSSCSTVINSGEVESDSQETDQIQESPDPTIQFQENLED